MSLRIGPAGLRSRVTLQTPMDGVDDAGALTRVWTSLVDLWAKVEPQRGSEFFSAGAQVTLLTHNVTIRWRARSLERHALSARIARALHSRRLRSGRSQDIHGLPLRRICSVI